MAESAFLLKQSTTLLTPANDPVSLDVVSTIPVGTTFRVDIFRPRNPAFHRKFMKLCQVAFESWHPGDGPKNFDSFRKDLLILAGFRKEYISLATQEIRFEAESIAFANMAESRFHQVYRAVLNVIWEQIYSKQAAWTRGDLDRLAERILHFE